MPRVKFFTMLRKVTGEPGYDSSAPTVAAVMKEIERKYGSGASRYMKSCIVLVNGRNIGCMKGGRTRLGPEDEVSLFPRVAGG
jgi:molybdopterin converting factor small subunit